MDLLGRSVFFLGADGEGFVLARGDMAFAVEPRLCAGVVAWGAERSRQPAAELLGGEGLAHVGTGDQRIDRET
jgi:hypothetical protein